MIERSRVSIPAGAAREFSSPGSAFCADSYFGMRVCVCACMLVVHAGNRTRSCMFSSPFRCHLICVTVDQLTGG